MLRFVLLTLTLVLLVATPGQALAHGFGQSQNLPLPFWLYLFAAAAVVLVSFVQISLFVTERRALPRYPRFDLLQIGPLRALLTARPFLFGLDAVPDVGADDPLYGFQPLDPLPAHRREE